MRGLQNKIRETKNRLRGKRILSNNRKFTRFLNKTITKHKNYIDSVCDLEDLLSNARHLNILKEKGYDNEFIEMQCVSNINVLASYTNSYKKNNQKPSYLHDPYIHKVDSLKDMFWNIILNE